MVEEPQWLTPEEARAWRALVAVMLLLPGALDAQLIRDSGLNHFEYGALALLSEAEDQTLRMSQLAALNDSSLSRLSHVVSRLEQRGAVERFTCDQDRRAHNVRLTDVGQCLVEAAAPGHVRRVRELIFDWLSARQVNQLAEIAGAISSNLDPENRLSPDRAAHETPD